MSSSYKTPNLGLNSWIGTDKPKRSDFNADNEILDETLGAHLADAVVHLTAAERSKWNRGALTFGSYTGNGEVSAVIPLGFYPTLVVVFPADQPFAYYNAVDSSNEILGGLAMRTGHTLGISLTENGFSVLNVQTVPMDGKSSRLNQSGQTYLYLAVAE